jgi:hypothetical protein
MSVGVMEDYKLRDLRASHTLGWSRGTGTPKDKDEVKNDLQISPFVCLL